MYFFVLFIVVWFCVFCCDGRFAFSVGCSGFGCLFNEIVYGLFVFGCYLCVWLIFCCLWWWLLVINFLMLLCNCMSFFGWCWWRCVCVLLVKNCLLLVCLVCLCWCDWCVRFWDILWGRMCCVWVGLMRCWWCVWMMLLLWGCGWLIKRFKG